MAHAPLLDLSTLVDSRPPIRIDGETYHLKSPEELTLLESQQFTSWGKELEQLGREEGATDALTALVGVVARAVLADVPIAVFDRLSPTHRMNIIEVFTGLRLERRLRLAGVIAKQVRQQTGENSSPASSAPSVETPAGGSTAPQPHS